MARLVELTGGYTETPHEEQDDAEDGKDAGGPNRTWETSGGRRRGDGGATVGFDAEKETKGEKHIRILFSICCECVSAS